MPPPSAPAALWGESGAGLPSSKDIEPVTSGKAVQPAPTIGYVGRYALKHLLGEGGLGAVYAAHDPLLSRLIAVKTLNVKVDDAERDAFNAIFLNEARAAGGLSHPHIVTVFDAGVSDNRAYIAMELLKGRDLRQLRQEGWRPTPTQAALLVRRVADALAYAHSRGVIHRDIKPANIFMVSRGQPRVLDFGIAHITYQRDGAKPSAVVAGSPYYMAPEQVRKEAGDRRTDVFSLGVVLYELLTDTKPFVGDSLDEILTAVQSHRPPLASVVDRSVPQALAEIAARAMAKEPNDRFRSARSFSRDLRQWLEMNPSDLEADMSIQSAVELPPEIRKKPWLAVGLIGTCVLAAGLVYGFVDRLDAPASNTPIAVAPAVPPAPAPAPTPTPRPDSNATVSPAANDSAPPALVENVSTPVAADSVPANDGASGGYASAGQSPLAVLTNPGTSAAPPPNPTVTVAATPPNPTVTVVAAPPVALLLAHKEAKPAAKEAPKETPKERKARETRERDLRAGAATSPVASATGTVSIAVSPWGTVEVDGNPSGTAPPLHELTLAEGRHQITIRNTDFPPYSSTVTVTADQPVVIKHKFGL